MPSTIGRYQVVSCIGEGGMGTVYRAHDPRLGRDVAIKTLLAGGPIGPTFLQRFRREFQVLVSLGEHPNIVTLHDYIEDPPAMVMELLRGEALDVALARARGALPRERVLRIMTHTLEAVGFAHSRGVVHRDLKPANLFLVDLDGTEQVKVMDFGIAALASPDQKLTATGVVLGTVDYMSPEQLMGQPVDARADIYALGIVLYELCPRRVPLPGESMFSVINAHVREPLPDPRLVNPALPDDLVSVIEIATAKQAERRFSSCRAMLNALQGALRGPSATTRPAAGAAVGGPAGTSPYPLAGGNGCDLRHWRTAADTGAVRNGCAVPGLMEQRRRRHLHGLGADVPGLCLLRLRAGSHCGQHGHHDHPVGAGRRGGARRRHRGREAARNGLGGRCAHLRVPGVHHLAGAGAQSNESGTFNKPGLTAQHQPIRHHITLFQR